MKIPFSPPDVGQEEINEIIEVINSGWITTGPKTKELEKQIAQYCNTSKAVCLNSATSCLESILRFLCIGAGDEVITTAYTYTATASPVLHVGATLKLIDTKTDCFEMDYDKLPEMITPNTKAVIGVDLAGVIIDYDKIYEAVNAKASCFKPVNKIQEAMGRVAVIADAAHAFGSSRNGKMAGEIADFTSFSFHAVKNFTTAEGGALTWKPINGISDEEIYKEFMIMSLHGQSKDAYQKDETNNWEYDVAYPAYKCNMTDITAAMGLAQMKRYGGMLERRKQIIEKYDKAFIPLGLIPLSHYNSSSNSNGHLYLLRLPEFSEEQRNEFIQALDERGVTANVHFKPLPMFTGYNTLGFDIGNYPNAYKQYANEVTIPLYSKLTDEQVDYIIEKVVETYKCF